MQRRELLAGVAAMSALSAATWANAAPNSYGLKGYIRTNWSRDPYSFGSYSYVAKGTGKTEYSALEAPVFDRLFFAGEATYPDFNSTVHAAYLSGQRAGRSVLETGHSRIIIVGAGISGLSAAHALSKEGREVTVLEARDRMGGRVWTDNSLGFAADLGASWIHGVRGNPLTGIADRLEIKRDKTRNDTVVRGRDGRMISWGEIPSRLTDEDEIQVAYGAEKELIDPSALSENDGFEGHDVSFPQGYAQIFKALEGSYSVELSKTVSAIRYDHSGVEIGLVDGESRLGDCVIVTIPLGVLKREQIAFYPPLPATKQEAIARMGMGLLDKLYLKFEQAFWDQDATWILTPETDFARGQFGQWFNLGAYIDEPVIVALNGGSAALALASHSNEKLQDMALAVLRFAYPRQ